MENLIDDLRRYIFQYLYADFHKIMFVCKKWKLLVEEITKGDHKNSIECLFGDFYHFYCKYHYNTTNDEDLSHHHFLSKMIGSKQIKLLTKKYYHDQIDKDKTLQWASKNGHLRIVHYLVDRSADIHADDDYALRWSAFNGHLEIVRYLANHGANINACNNCDFKPSALQLSASSGHLEVVRYLVDHGANIHVDLHPAQQDARSI